MEELQLALRAESQWHSVGHSTSWEDGEPILHPPPDDNTEATFLRRDLSDQKEAPGKQEEEICTEIMVVKYLSLSSTVKTIQQNREWGELIVKDTVCDRHSSEHLKRSEACKHLRSSKYPWFWAPCSIFPAFLCLCLLVPQQTRRMYGRSLQTEMKRNKITSLWYHLGCFTWRLASDGFKEDTPCPHGGRQLYC